MIESELIHKEGKKIIMDINEVNTLRNRIIEIDNNCTSIKLNNLYTLVNSSQDWTVIGNTGLVSKPFSDALGKMVNERYVELKSAITEYQEVLNNIESLINEEQNYSNIRSDISSLDKESDSYDRRYDSLSDKKRLSLSRINELKAKLN